jgi:multiple sugar transport system ATP-binding protein
LIPIGQGNRSLAGSEGSFRRSAQGIEEVQMASVVAKDIRKDFGDVAAVDGVSLSVCDGEFLVLLGPSGCGKTTFLRIIAGLERQTSGDVLINDEVVNDITPRARGVAMVFQSYGLYPHLTVANNIAFPLRTQGTPRPEIKRKVDWAAGLLGIDHLLNRRPRQLSGGERQRVALARALVRNPTVFLLDEPLSNLDAKLRASARSELKQFQQKVGTTTIYVTHDQVEAMGMGDRIAVIDHGRLRQIGTPSEIYDHPADDFVASFLGTPPMNLVEHRGGVLGFQAKREVTAKLPAHVPLSGIHAGEWHKFAVREAELRYFDRDGRRTVSPKEQAR